MKIHAHILAWNEEKILPFTLDYYSTLCEKIFIWDNMSTDNSDNIYKKYNKVEVIKWNSNNTLNDGIHSQIKSTCYKLYSMDCDYVIVCDCDEFLYDENIIQKLEQCKINGIDLPNSVSYNMASDFFPPYTGELLTNIVKVGTYGDDKRIIFNPKIEMYYGFGSHSCSYNGKTSYDKRFSFKILHYRYLSRDYMLERHKKMAARLSEFNLKNKFGVHYFNDHTDYMNRIIKDNINVVDTYIGKKEVKIVSDFSIEDVPHGGAERVDDVIRKYLKAEFLYSKDIRCFDPKYFYIISNISLLPNKVSKTLLFCDYILLEHDSKICLSRNPWQYNKESKVPKDQLINLDLYKNAKAILVQTTDHLNVFKINNIEGNFINLKSSLWDNEDLELLKKVLSRNLNKDNKAAIYDSNNFIKNTQSAIQYCKNKNIEYELISNQPTREEFLEKLAKHCKLVFFPLARETLSRLVVEARCLNMKIITTNNYGAILEDWFNKFSGNELIDFLKENTNHNLQIIKNLIDDLYE